MIGSSSRSMARGRAARLMETFQSQGAVPVDADMLLPADTLLDLYGEDIRARAYVTSDPLRGEMMMRPDFTVPVVQMHMRDQAEPARYTYSGEVFRKQEMLESRPIEYLQVGYEVFDGSNPATADAEVFALFSKELSPLNLRVSTGDIGILTAAVQGLDTTDARKSALLRHLWRPRRFRALLDRFGGRTPAPTGRAALLENPDPLANIGPVAGLRREDEIATRIQALREDAAAKPISGEQIDLLDALLDLRETVPNILIALRDISVDLPSISAAVDRISARSDAMAAQGVDVENLIFEGSYGRTSMEYYDGFVFGFYAPGRPDLPPVATGGRYDALTRFLGKGREIPAVGGVIRPELLVELESTS
ncbi:ATP phosphoribosyltransferase regulatory subunit [Aestuariibius sp. HNIBRBA575]|uniref:ATP phosphoribosyltransferase regulatory subunit n=1 Tax=Aestuariibius sp. HNIBRBA575 TaxID=3233343 RepID=UPI0034A53241